MRTHEDAIDLATTALDFPISDGERAALEAHLARCPDCRQEVGAIRRDALRLQSLEPIAPPAWVARAIGRKRRSIATLLLAAALAIGGTIGAATIVGGVLDRMTAVLPTGTPSSSIPATAHPTPTPAPTIAACPSLDEAISVAAYFDALDREPREGEPPCFEGQDVTLLGWADALPAVGFMPPGIAPGWLWVPTGALWDRNCDEACAFLGIHVDPGSDVEWDGNGLWVLVTGHTGDPLAETCQWVYPEDWTESPLPVSQATEQCRGSFVVTSVERTPTVP